MTLFGFKFGRCIARVLSGTVATAACLLSGCGTVNGGGPAVAQLRVVTASPDVGGLDMYASTGAIAYNLGFGTVTSYVPVTPSTYALSVNTAGTRKALNTVRGTLAASKQYTLLVSNFASTLQTQVLTDQSVPAPSGEISLRFLDEALAAGTVDLYLVPAGSRLDKVNAFQQGVVFGANTGYLNVPAGSYTLYVVQNGTLVSSTTVPLYTGSATNYLAGSARTFLILDQQLAITPAVSVTMLSDYDSATVTQP